MDESRWGVWALGGSEEERCRPTVSMAMGLLTPRPAGKHKHQSGKHEVHEQREVGGVCVWCVCWEYLLTSLWDSGGQRGAWTQQVKVQRGAVRLVADQGARDRGSRFAWLHGTTARNEAADRTLVPPGRDGLQSKHTVRTRTASTF